MSVRARLAELRRAGALSALDEGFATTLDRMVGGASWEAVLGAAVASRAVSEGNVCVDLASLAGKALPALVTGDEPSAEPCPSLERWRDAIAASAFVTGGEAAPLVLDPSGRLYLRRYWEHEQRVIAAIRERVGVLDPVMADAELRSAIDRLFPRGNATPGAIDGQRIAAMVAARRRFTVITGGPGTGKTTTVVRILAILVEGLRRSLGRPPRIAVLAPTGKAAARLTESIARQRGQLAVEGSVRAAIPSAASTIHRALGAIGDSGRFRYDADNPHPADVVVVDEASMVPLALMSRLVRAMRGNARLLLLGDRDQLASVEAGAVLGDVCNAGEPIPISAALADDAARIAGETIRGSAGADEGAGGLADAIVELVGSRRFDPRRGIGALAAAIRSGDGRQAVAVLEEKSEAVRFVARPREGELAAELDRLVRTEWRAYAEAREPLAALSAFDALRVLSPLRVGPDGIEALNEAIERVLARANLVAPTSGHYPGRAILVTKNDYEARLFNGDVGVIVEREGTDRRRLAAAFLGAEGRERIVSTSLLPSHETAFAMTVHKSQGSEFERVAVVLPRKSSEVVTRELLYTAVTRARATVLVQGTRDDVLESIARRTVRSSGLRDALWGG